MRGECIEQVSAWTNPAHDAASTRSFPDLPLELRIRPERDRVRVIAAGELDLATSPALDEQLRELEQAGFDHIVVDLRGVSFIDCAGLQIMLGANRRARAARARFGIIGGGKVGRLLALTSGQHEFGTAAPSSGAAFRSGIRVTV